jgi:hypothetical protein
MSGKQKALLIGLGVVLVVLLVVAFGMNTGKKTGDPGKPNGIVNFLAKFGGKSSAVDPATVSADCSPVSGQPHTFKFTGGCTLTVADPGALRILIVHSTKPFHATAPAPGKADFTVDADASPSPTGATAKIAVDKRTEVGLVCQAGLNVACVITIAAE